MRTPPRTTFDEKNEELFEASAEANTWGNVTMPDRRQHGLSCSTFCLPSSADSRRFPDMGNFGLVRSRTAHLGHARLPADAVAFLREPARSGVHAVQHGDDGARRRIPYLRSSWTRQPEDDDGSVTLVNVELGEDGRTMTEVDHETGHWAWKREESDDGTRSLKAAQSLEPACCRSSDEGP